MNKVNALWFYFEIFPLCDTSKNGIEMDQWKTSDS